MNKQKNTEEFKGDSSLEKFARKNKSKKRLIKYICTIGIILLVIIFTVICFAFFFKVRTVEVEGASKYSEDLIIIKSGITAGENLYKYRENDIEEILSLTYPYISDVKLSYRLPDKIVLKITEDSPSYVTTVYGENLILSSTARILENTEQSIESTELCVLKLPEIDRALVGKQPVYTNKSDYVNKVLSAVEKSSIGKQITYIDLESKFGIYFLIDTRYKIKCGSSEDFAVKLDTTEKILKSGRIPSGEKAEIDVSNPDECSAIIGAQAVIK